jgi:uncharacterized repeat protein (TIGR01451 family)
VFAALCLLATMAAALAQTCAAPGKDAPGTISGVVNTYFQGNGNLTAGATTLTLGAASGAGGTATVGDLLLVIQMQGATILEAQDERYGDGSGTAGNQPDSSASQGAGYTALNEAGSYEFVRVTTVAAGNIVTFSPALANSYVQAAALGANPRKTYQVIRVPQYPSATISSAAAVTTLPWTGLVGGVVAIDVAGQLTFTGSGPHVTATNAGFRGGAQGVADSSCCNTVAANSYSTITADGGGKGEGISGTPRYVATSTAGSYNAGTRFSDAVGTTVDNGAQGYLSGDFMRGAPGNAGGGGNSHNAAGGGGGNGGAGGNGGQTYNGDGQRDLGGWGGARLPQTGSLLATRIFMGGGGGSGSLNDGSPTRGQGGRGGGIVMLRAGAISGSGTLNADGQRGWDSDVGQDAGGGGGAGGSILVLAGSGHGNITAQARGGNGADSNLNTNSLSAAPPAGTQTGGCCAGEREGPGGGGGGGVVISNASLGSMALSGGTNGLSREDKFQGFSGNMRSSPGQNGTNAIFTTSAFNGARPGYECAPALTVTKSTGTPTRTVPPDTTGSYTIVIANPATASGMAFGIAVLDTLPPPFQLTGTTYAVTLSNGACAQGTCGPVGPLASSTTGAGTGTISLGTAGSPTASLSLQPGASATVTFNIGLNGAAAGTYQNNASVRLTDPTRTSGGTATSVLNPTTSPGSTNAAGSTMPGSNYSSGSSTAEDITVSGAAGTSADLAMAKSGSASSADVGSAFQYTLTITNNGPANVTGSVTISDNVPANIGTVTWVCSVIGGTADCSTVQGGTGASGSGNAVSLPNASLNSGGQLQIVISGTVASTGTSITNTATVALPAGYTDPVASNNTGTVTATFTTPTADLSITKTAGVTSIVTGGVLQYTISVLNAGPSAANGAVITDPAATGLAKLSVSCSSSGGAVCPGSLSTTTFEAGIAIPVLPAGGALTFLLNAQATGAVGTTVTNTVSITAPAGVTDPNAANNTSKDADAVVAVSAKVTSAAQICPAGTTEQLTNLLSNSNFSDTTLSVNSTLPQYPANSNITDAIASPGGVGPQTGFRNPGTYMTQQPFPGDSARGVAAANNWLYSNGNNPGGAFRIWRQSVSGLVAGRTYEFMAYGSAARPVGGTTAQPPIVSQVVSMGTTTWTLSATTYNTEATGTSDTWTIQQSIFTATDTSVILDLWDTQASATTAGDNFAVTQILLRECRPNPDVFVTKTNGTNTVTTFTTTNYVVTVGNLGPGSADNVLVKDAAVTGMTKTTISCSATGGASCPLAVTTSGIEGAGLTIPTLPVNGTVVFTITASITAINGTLTNTVQVTLPSGVTDVNSANNTAQDVDTVRGSSQLTIAKDNGVTSVTSGGTTAYTITISNLGPSAADNAVVQDPVSTGLSCTAAATCTGTGGASCAASIPAATLQTGYTIPSLPSGGSIAVRMVCTVTATGS